MNIKKNRYTLLKIHKEQFNKYVFFFFFAFFFFFFDFGSTGLTPGSSVYTALSIYTHSHTIQL